MVNGMGITDRELPTQDEGFYEALQQEDHLGVVIRSHIYIEHEVVELLKASWLDYACVAKMNLRYEQKVELAGAVGLEDSFLPPLRKLGKIRNDFAHRLGTNLTRQREDEFLRLALHNVQVARSTMAR